MARLEDLIRGAQVKGVRTDGPVEVVDAKWYGTSAIELTFKDAQGRPGNELLYRTVVTENARTLKFKSQGFEED